VTGRCVVVTGLGLVTPLGMGLPANAAALAAGRSAIAPATLLDASPFSSALAGEVRGLDARPYFRTPKALKLCDRRTRLAVAAAALALEDAAFPGSSLERLGVALGTSGSDLGAEELSAALSRMAAPQRAAEEPAVFGAEALPGMNPLWLLLHLPNMASAHVAIQLEARGPNTTVMTGEAAGLQAVVEGAEWIREGRADAVLAGGADAPVHPFAFAAFEQAGRFAGPSPLVPAEGAAVLLLEERASALARGARPLAELGSHALDADGAARLALSTTPVPATPLERLAGNLLAALAPAALALALAEGLAAPVAASVAGPFGEACALSAVPADARERNAA